GRRKGLKICRTPPGPIATDRYRLVFAGLWRRVVTSGINQSAQVVATVSATLQTLLAAHTNAPNACSHPPHAPFSSDGTQTPFTPISVAHSESVHASFR